MNNRETALEYLRCFCDGDISGLEPLLAEDLQFSGPLFQFDSRAAYLDSLTADPLEKYSYKILSITESPQAVAIFYDFEKRDRDLTIAQMFKFKNQEIAEIIIVFDGRGFE